MEGKCTHCGTGMPILTPPTQADPVTSAALGMLSVSCAVSRRGIQKIEHCLLDFDTPIRIGNQIHIRRAVLEHAALKVSGLRLLSASNPSHSALRVKKVFTPYADPQYRLCSARRCRRLGDGFVGQFAPAQCAREAATSVQLIGRCVLYHANGLVAAESPRLRAAVRGAKTAISLSRSASNSNSSILWMSRAKYNML